jgi:hypothetical protein
MLTLEEIWEWINLIIFDESNPEVKNNLERWQIIHDLLCFLGLIFSDIVKIICDADKIVLKIFRVLLVILFGEYIWK